MAHISLDQARAAKRAAQARLQAAGHDDAAVGITRVDGEYAVKVNVQTAGEARAVGPREIDGVSVRVEVVGAIRPRKAAGAGRRP